MNNLVIDIGNTFSKIAIFNQRELIKFYQFDKIEIDKLALIINDFEVTKSTISTVNDNVSDLEKFLTDKTRYLRFVVAELGSIKNYYLSKDTLGLDRWANIIAAHFLFHGAHNLIIDAGTCITVDTLTAQDEYFGGSISPGIGMRFKSLNYYTKRLPLVDWHNEKYLVEHGNNTINAIKTGVFKGVLNEIEGYFREEHQKNNKLNILLTGGDSIFLAKPLKNSIFAAHIIHDPFLVLRGLNEALNIE